MKPEMTDTIHDTPFSQCLYMAIELSHGKWLLGFTIGFGQAPRLRSLVARDLKALAEEIELAKKRFKLAADIQVRSCYEAGRDGFSRRTSGRCGCIVTWPPRVLTTESSIQPVLKSTGANGERRRIVWMCANC